MPHDPYDVDLDDVELMEEVELMATLIVAAAESDDRLDPEQVDRLLDVVHVSTPHSR